ETSGLVAHAHRRADEALQPPADAALPSVCGPRRLIEPPDTGAQFASPPSPVPQSGVPNQKGFRPARGCPRNVSTPSRPQRHAVSVRSAGMPPDVDRRFGMNLATLG